MGFHAWTQDVPIDASTYQRINDRLGSASMPGLVVHLAIELPDGTLRYLDVWESAQACEAALDSVIHPAVHGVLAELGFSEPPPEPARTPVQVLDVRVATGRVAAG